MENVQDEGSAAETSLTKHFLAIEHPQLKLANLTRLADSLTPWEARHLRLCLQRCKGLAGLEDLPLELVTLIASHLELEDVYSCFAVSTAWRRIWTSPVIAQSLCAYFFPRSPKPHDLAAFRAASLVRHRMEHGLYTSKLEKRFQYDSETYFRLDPEFHPDGKYPPLLDASRAWLVDMVGGNLVWLVGASVLVVDQLATRKRRVLVIDKGLETLYSLAGFQTIVVGESLIMTSRDGLKMYVNAISFPFHPHPFLLFFLVS